MEVLQAKNLKKIYGSGNNAVHALDGVDLSVKKGEFVAMYEEYVKNPETTKMRMFYETMEDVLPGMKIVIDNGSGVEKILPLDSFSGDWKTEEDTSEETK